MTWTSASDAQACATIYGFGALKRAGVSQAYQYRFLKRTHDPCGIPNGGFPKLGVPFVGPHNKDYSIWGSILGSLILGNHHMSLVCRKGSTVARNSPNNGSGLGLFLQTTKAMLFMLRLSQD